MAEIKAGPRETRPLRVGDRIRIISAAMGALGVNGTEGVVVVGEPSTNGRMDDPHSLLVRTDNEKVWAVGRREEIEWEMVEPWLVPPHERTLADPPDDDDISVPNATSEPPAIKPPLKAVHYPGTPRDQKPMVTRAQYEAGRAVLDALPPGLYVKCAVCAGWQHGGEFVVRSGGSHITCEKCRG